MLPFTALKNWAICSILATSSLVAAAQDRVSILTIASFEKSNFFQTYRPQASKPYALATGDTNFGYTTPDPDQSGTERVSVALFGSQNFVTKASVVLIGRNINLPAQLTDARAKYLAEFAKAVEPSANTGELLKYVRANQGFNYPGGSEKMPRQQIGALSVYAGKNGSALIVGIEK